MMDMRVVNDVQVIIETAERMAVDGVVNRESWKNQTKAEQECACE
jgi:hypothetical protein